MSLIWQMVKRPSVLIDLRNIRSKKYREKYNRAPLTLAPADCSAVQSTDDSTLRWASRRAGTIPFHEQRLGGNLGEVAFDRITADPHKMDGATCILGPLILVATVVGMVADSMS